MRATSCAPRPGTRPVRVADVEGVLAAGDVLGDAFELPVDWCQRLLGVGFAGRTDAAASCACTTAGRSPWPAAP